MYGVAGRRGLHVVLLVAPEQKPGFEISLLTKQMAERLAVGIALKQLNYLVEPVLQVRILFYYIFNQIMKLTTFQMYVNCFC